MHGLNVLSICLTNKTSKGLNILKKVLHTMLIKVFYSLLFLHAHSLLVVFRHKKAPHKNFRPVRGERFKIIRLVVFRFVK